MGKTKQQVIRMIDMLHDARNSQRQKAAESTAMGSAIGRQERRHENKAKAQKEKKDAK